MDYDASFSAWNTRIKDTFLCIIYYDKILSNIQLNHITSVAEIYIWLATLQEVHTLLC